MFMKKQLTRIAAFLMVLTLAFTVLPEQAQAASGIKLNKSRITLYTDGTTTLKVTGTSRKVSYTSNRKSVATVTSKGKVTARKAGTAIITAKVGNKKLKCKVTVKKENLKLNKSKVTLYAGKSITLKATGTSRKVSYTSNKKSVATVTSKGKVTAKKAGTAIITAKAGKKKVTCKVTVKEKKPTSENAVSIYWNGEKTIKVTETTKTVEWESSNKSIVTVKSDGTNSAVLTGKKIGTTTITAKVDGKAFKKYSVTVKMKTSPLTKKEKELAFYMQGKYDDCIMYNTLSSDADLKYFGLTREFDNRNLWNTHKKALKTMRKYLPGRAVYICDVSTWKGGMDKGAELERKGVKYVCSSTTSHNHGKVEKWSVMWIK